MWRKVMENEWRNSWVFNCKQYISLWAPFLIFVFMYKFLKPHSFFLTFLRHKRKCDERSWRMNDMIVESLIVNNTLIYEPRFLFFVFMYNFLKSHSFFLTFLRCKRKCDEKSWRMNDIIVESLIVNNTLTYEPYFLFFVFMYNFLKPHSFFLTFLSRKNL